jgi:hypothetical protein
VGLDLRGAILPGCIDAPLKLKLESALTARLIGKLEPFSTLVIALLESRTLSFLGGNLLALIYTSQLGFSDLTGKDVLDVRYFAGHISIPLLADDIEVCKPRTACKNRPKTLRLLTP